MPDHVLVVLVVDVLLGVFLLGVEECGGLLLVVDGHEELGLELGLIKAWKGLSGIGGLKMRSC